MNLEILAQASAPSLDFLSSFFWQFLVIIVAIIAIIGFIVYRYYIEPPIARQMTTAKWKGGSPAFIQDDAGVVHFTVSDHELPEGVMHNRRGWFLRSRSPYLSDHRGPGRPKGSKKTDGEEDKEKTSDKELAQSEVLETVLQAPILAGLGKAVFFGYDGAPLLCNLKTLALSGNNSVLSEKKDSKSPYDKWRVAAFANLRLMKEIIPATISRTQLGNLVKWAMQKGYEKRGGDTNKFFLYVIGAIVVIAALGLVVYLILQGGGK